jgi:hypothetical protein
MGNDMEELLNFTIAISFHNPCLFGYGNSWIFIQPPLGPLKIRSENLFFYIEYAWLMFSFMQVMFYVTMGMAYLGWGSIPP